MKEKLDNVRGRRKPKEALGESRDSLSTSDTVEKGSTDVALATLDSVLDTYQGPEGQAVPVVTRQESVLASSSSKQGRRKRNKDSNSSAQVIAHGGGTWPRTKGGPIIDQGTGTILHPQKTKKERLPLAELLNNLPKYPPEKKDSVESSKTRNDNVLMRSSRDHSSRRHQRPLTTYEVPPDMHR